MPMDKKDRRIRALENALECQTERAVKAEKKVKKYQSLYGGYKSASKKEWISVDEYLPLTENDEFESYYDVEVIVYAGGYVEFDLFTAGRSPKFWSKFDTDDVTHWMPLPEPPD